MVQNRAETLLQLKQIVREHSPFHGRSFHTSQTLPLQIPKAALTEFSSSLGAGVTQAVLTFLKEQTGRVAWIEPHLTLYPPAVAQMKISSSRFFYLEAGAEPVWAALECLRSQLFSFVVLTDVGANEKDLRRLQMAAEKSGCTVLLIHHGEVNRTSWPLSQHIQIQRWKGRLSVKTFSQSESETEPTRSFSLREGAAG